MKQTLAAVAVVLSGACVLAQESPGNVRESQPDSSVSVEPAVPQSPLVRGHLQRVQAWFDETNDQIFYRLAFVASISEIRAIRPADKLIGVLAEGEVDVAVLRVRAMGRQADVGFKKSSVIVCPIGELRSFWEAHSKNAEMLFEYNRIGKRETVQKFGC